MSRLVLLRVGLWTAAVGFGLSQAAAQPPLPNAVKSADVVSHLEQTITWFRQVHAVEPPLDSTGVVVLRDSTQQTALKALQLAFDFARAEAVLIETQKHPAAGAPATGTSGAGRNMDQAAARAVDRVNGLQAQIKTLDEALDKAPQRTRSALIAQRDELSAELNLAKEVQQTIQSMVAFAGNLGSAPGAAGALSSQIDDLERTVPQAVHDQRAAPSAPAATNAATTTATPSGGQTFNPEAAGVFALATELFSILRSRSQLSGLMVSTDALLKQIDALKVPLVQAVRDSIQQGEKLGNEATSADAQDLTAGQREMNALSARFKQLSTALLPLGEQGIVVEKTKGDLLGLQSSTTHTFNQTARYFLMRAVGMVAAILVILVLSALWRRVSFRYIRDTRRRGQFMVLRRVVVWCAIALVIILGFVSEFGSLATYAGLLTAGIAVALQNVILSVVAYFFLIGRYGIRIGDRVTVSGVTGNVIDIGLVRFYLMEIAGSGADKHATGRVVVFSNAVIFQPSALFKQMPGTNYVWHELILELTPESDPQLAEKKLTAAVNAVFEEYREKIEQQHAEFARSVDIDVIAPHPETRLRIIGSGLEFQARYPVEIEQGNSTDDRMTKALYDAVASAGAPDKSRPGLTLSGSPKLQETV